MRFWAILEASGCGDGVFAVGPKHIRPADVAQLAERVLGKDEVVGSIPNEGSKRTRPCRPKTAGGAQPW